MKTLANYLILGIVIMGIIAISILPDNAFTEIMFTSGLILRIFI